MKKIPELLKTQIGLIIIGIILIIISYQYLDRPLVFLLENHNSQQYFFLKWITHLDLPINILVFLSFPILTIRYFYKKTNHHDNAALAISLAVAITVYLKNILKFVFGRYWPATWINDNLSLLHDSAYGFTWLNRDPAYQSFPSGHIALTTAFMAALALFYPKLKYFSILIIALMIIAQVGLNYHFLSDAITGGLIGYLVAYNTVLYIKKSH